MKITVTSCFHLPSVRHLIVWLSLPLAFIVTGWHSLYASPFDVHKGASHGNPTSNYGKRYSENILRGVTLEDVYIFNDTNTALKTPAYANVWTTSANFLQCLPPSGKQFSYALCYYSGPDAPTGNSDENPSLPCTLSPDGTVANCTCYEISTDPGTPRMPYLVDIHAISNLDIYKDTVEVCGDQGIKCLNSGRIPPVCEAINTNLLVPGADLISVFTPRFARDYVNPEGSSTDCTKKKDQQLYAGCMTAPCYRTNKTDEAGRNLVECKCPVYDGPFQIGQGGQSCNANDSPPPSTTVSSNPKKKHWGNKKKGWGDNVWSAAYNPAGGPIIISNAECIPDLPGEGGCPLYDPETDYNIDPNGRLCERVCEYYGTSNKANLNDPDVQLGYSCDATLCTTLGIGQGDNPPPGPETEARLLGEACSGIRNMNGLTEIALLEGLAQCSCCASQVCGCDNINQQTNEAISELNDEQKEAGIYTQCFLNGTLCGADDE